MVKRLKTEENSSREKNDRILYDSISQEYLRKDITPSSALAREYKLLFSLKRILSQKSNLGTLVDVGCGVGATAKYLSGHYEKYIGIDQSEQLIDQAKDLNRKNQRVEFITANIKSDDLPQHEADVLFASGALHHMTELDEVMVALKKLAANGAYIVVNEPQKTNKIVQLMRFIRGFIDKSYSQEQEFFTPEFLVELFHKHGVKEVEVGYQGYLSTPFAEVIMHPQFLFRPLSMTAVVLDEFLEKYLPTFLRKQSFNIVVSGKIFH